jgi:hypothetical protein
VAGSFARPPQALAVDAPLLLNAENHADLTTRLSLDTSSTDPVALSVSAVTDGLWVMSTNGAAVRGHGKGLEPGIKGISSGGGAGLVGQSYSGAQGIVWTPGNTGVFGISTQDANSVGVGGASMDGTGVHGQSATGLGVHGVSSEFVAIKGESTGFAGVWGRSVNGPGVDGGSDTGHGVSGLTHAAGKAGVYGFSDAGRGVIGESLNSIGVFAKSTNNVALRVEGRLSLKRSGSVTAAAGARRVDATVSGGLPSGSMAFATLQGYQSGLAVAGVRLNYPSAGKLRIYFTKATTASIKASWLVVG